MSEQGPRDGGRWTAIGVAIAVVLVVAIAGKFVGGWRLTGHASGGGCGGAAGEAGAAAGPGMSVVHTGSFTCKGPMLAAPVGQTEMASWSCTLADDASRRSVKVLSVESAAPFTAEAPGGELGRGEALAIEVAFLPKVGGPSTGAVTIRFEQEGAEAEETFDVAAVALLAATWDVEPMVSPCRDPAPMLAPTLATAGIDARQVRLSEDDLAKSSAGKAGKLDDEFRVPALKTLRDDPTRGTCLVEAAAASLDVRLEGPHGVAAVIRHAARLLGGDATGPGPFGVAQSPGDFDEALEAVCEAADGACGDEMGAVPDDLRSALAPILWAIRAGVVARAGRDTPSSRGYPADFWRDHGGTSLLFSPDALGASSARPNDRRYLAQGRAPLYAAAARIAHAVQDVDWRKFAGRRDVRYDRKTPAGWVRIRDASDDRYEDDGEPTLLLVDLGGADKHLDQVASNLSGANSVSIAIDVAGEDHYGYAPVSSANDRPGLLPADADGRFAGDDTRGPIALSKRYRQGAARNGIAMLFDLGDGDDRYESLRGSQGYAHQGVGVLFDAGGDDRYLAESVSQGAAQFGIALLLDAGAGKDERRSFYASQGFGFVGGAGVLLDGGGDDSYTCEAGEAAQGAVLLFPSPQLPGEANTSLCQGVGFGLRDPGSNSLSGGIGILRDKAGDDRYLASVYAQGAGYWQGVGILSDGAGSDHYDARYYADGAGVHYAVGLLVDSGPEGDVVGDTYAPATIGLGAGNDHSVGVFVNEGGRDVYNIRGKSAGDVVCGGIGIFLDGAGRNRFVGGELQGARVVPDCSHESIEIPGVALAVDVAVAPRGR